MARRAVTMFAVIIALVCLTGCGILEGMVQALYDDPETPTLPKDDESLLYNAARCDGVSMAVFDPAQPEGARARTANVPGV
jgi:hypothetical protein